MKKLRLILGDQLNRTHSWFSTINSDVVYVFIESRSETGYVRHHIQKVVGFFLAMRNFAQELREEGHQVRYIRLDDPENQGSITQNLNYILDKGEVAEVGYQLPDEYRLDRELREWADRQSIPVAPVDTEHFLTRREAIGEFFAGKKQFLMESFYRGIRKEYQLLLEDDGESPVGGKWNYDDANRKSLPQKVEIPAAYLARHSAQEIVQVLEKEGVETIGSIDPGNFFWPINREESLEALEHFATTLLSDFGTYQDALTDRDPFLFHSRLSFCLNTKMLSPLEVVQRCIHEWESRKDEISLPQIEGFIRQIIGWREYMHGIYWAKMPDYAELNFFDHQAKLPDWYWTGDTQMKCLSHAISQSLEYAYAHHIQRLMVTGNFALLLGVNPDELDEWYLGIYIDAIQWVEITNTRGMSQFADGGIVGTKPYVSSANYIKKMSDYCKGCAYNPNLKAGEEGACPFNSLYWDFYDRHRDKLAGNPRIGMMYSTWDRMAAEKKEALLKQAKEYKEGVESL